MKEKLKLFMQRGGLTLLIGFLAVGAYLFILDVANQYFDKNVTNSLYISVNENGELSVNYSKTDEEIYVCWETDGGNIKPVEQNSEFQEQYKEDNKWYQAYAKVHDKVKWDSMDADGNQYTTANVRALIYQKSEQEEKNQYYLGDFVKDLTITITVKDGKVEKAEDRYFSNPIRKGEEESWNQIYIVDRTENTYTLRYRTSENLSKKDNDKIYVLCWENDENIMAETDIIEGSIPNFSYILEENESLTDRLNTVNTVTLDFKDTNFKEANIVAFLVDSEKYKSYQQEDKEYIAKAALAK